MYIFSHLGTKFEVHLNLLIIQQTNSTPELKLSTPELKLSTPELKLQHPNQTWLLAPTLSSRCRSPVSPSSRSPRPSTHRRRPWRRLCRSPVSHSSRSPRPSTHRRPHRRLWRRLCPWPVSPSSRSPRTSTHRRRTRRRLFRSPVSPSSRSPRSSIGVIARVCCAISFTVAQFRKHLIRCPTSTMHSKSSIVEVTLDFNL